LPIGPSSPGAFLAATALREGVIEADVLETLSRDRGKVKVSAKGCTWEGGWGLEGRENVSGEGKDEEWRMGETGAKEESRKHSWGEGRLVSRQVSKVKVAPGGICCGVTGDF